MRLTAFVLLATGAALCGGSAPGAAPVPKHLMKGEEPDLQALQGEWKLTQFVLGGQNLGADIVEVVMEFRGNALIATTTQQNQRTTATLKFDSKANPPQMSCAELKVTDLKGAPVKNPEAEKPCAMIYKLEADTLVLAVNTGNQTQPPKDFGGKNDSGVATLTFTRVKK